ncbi:hypothetical protein Dip510_000074 [Elusimicrobium posterum]|uniref:hypothetical protein n=1 Tax=Elusimicrobium posterum TaxID=3116653 RepID=UPI003C73649E
MITKIKNYIKSLLSDSTGSPSSRLHLGWLLSISSIALAFAYIFSSGNKDVYKIIELFLIIAGGCFGVSVFGELKNQTQIKEDKENA